MSTLTPLLKFKVDELFIRWLSSPETQSQLRDDLKQISYGYSPPSSPRPSTPKEKNSLSIVTRPVSPPAPPPSSPTVPGKSPKSPRRRLSSSTSNRRHTQKNSAKNKSKKDGKDKIVPGCAKNLPQFFFPFGKPDSSGKLQDESKFKFACQLLAKLPKQCATEENFTELTKTLGLPLYWKGPLFSFCGGSKSGAVTLASFEDRWKRVISTYHDEHARLFKLMAKPGLSYLKTEDFNVLVQDVINTHPGLQFLVEAPEFHSRYVTTVISRIFYSLNRSWSGKITLSELRKSNFLQVLVSLEEEDDINEVLDYFSYEHFYVIYCKFWELDTDHDLIIDQKDLSRYCNGALSTKMTKQIFSGCVTRGKGFVNDQMTYSDFVWFLLSEVDKNNPTSVEYWFRCMDIDGDGILSMYELEYFYEEQLEKMQRIGIETLSFNDCLCQVLDMVKPRIEGKITLPDLRNCKMAHVFFDTMFNLDRWLEFEQRDPFQGVRDSDDFGASEEPSDWEKYAAAEYELLVNEEGGNQEL